MKQADAMNKKENHFRKWKHSYGISKFFQGLSEASLKYAVITKIVKVTRRNIVGYINFKVTWNIFSTDTEVRKFSFDWYNPAHYIWEFYFALESFISLSISFQVKRNLIFRKL